MCVRSLVFASTLLAACAAPPGSGKGLDDPAIRAHLARVRGAAARPTPQGQEPRARKIDQVEPAGIGLRRYHIPGSPHRVTAEVGAGTLKVEVPATTLRDKAPVVDLRIGLDGAAESPQGPGIRLSAFVSDDDLFGGLLLNDGTAPRAADTRVLGFQGFPHLRIDGTADQVAVPVRIGVVVDAVTFDHRNAELDRSWLTVGARIEAEPRVPLLGPADGGLTLFGRFGGELGYGWFGERYGATDEGDHMHRWAYDLGLGLRWHPEGWTLDVGYEFGQSRFAATDTRLFGGDAGVELEHQRLFVGGSLIF